MPPFFYLVKLPKFIKPQSPYRQCGLKCLTMTNMTGMACMGTQTSSFLSTLQMHSLSRHSVPGNCDPPQSLCFLASLFSAAPDSIKLALRRLSQLYTGCQKLLSSFYGLKNDTRVWRTSKSPRYSSSCLAAL